MTYENNANNLLKRGLETFNKGDFYEAHELWEELWRQTDEQLRHFYQGLIHAAVGLHHLRRGNWTGAESQLRKSLRQLEKYPLRCCGINNAALQAALTQVLNENPTAPVRILLVDEIER